MKHAREDYDRIQDPAGKIPADEPVFLIRGQDLAAPEALRQYAIEAHRKGASIDIVIATLDQARAMEKWQRERARKTPDLPVLQDGSKAAELAETKGSTPDEGVLQDVTQIANKLRDALRAGKTVVIDGEPL